jgi:hypothetical protein
MSENLADVVPLFEVPDTDRERRIRLVVDEVRKTKGWPADDALDRQLAIDLIETYPRQDIPAEIRTWRGWMADHEKRPTKRGARTGVRNWFKQGRKFAGRRRPVGRRDVPAANGSTRRTSTAPRSDADFGEAAGGLRAW